MWPKKSIAAGVVIALAATTAFTLVTSADAAPAAGTANRVTAPGVPVQGQAKAARVGVRTDPSLKTLRQLGDRTHLKMGVAVGMVRSTRTRPTATWRRPSSPPSPPRTS